MKKISYSKNSFDEFDTGGPAEIETINWFEAPNRTPALFPLFFLATKRRGCHMVRHVQYPYATLEFVLKGEITFEQDGRSYRVSRNELFLMHRGHTSGFSTGPKDSYEKLTLGLLGSILDLLLDSLQLTRTSKITLLHPEEAKRRFLEIGELLKAKTPGSEQRITEKTFSLLLFLSSENRGCRERNYPASLHRALEFFQGEYMHSNLSMTDAAVFAGVSTPTLIRMFHKFFNQSPMEYVTAMRLELAGNLLESTFLSIKEIALQVGYNSPLYFSTVFRKYTGMSPREFRGRSGSPGSPLPAPSANNSRRSGNRA